MARPLTKREEATRWLKDYLSRGQRLVSLTEETGAAVGFEPRTLQRAKTHLGIESIRRGAVWYWRDPDVFEEQQGTPSLVEAIQELTRAVRQLAKADRSETVATLPQSEPAEPDELEPPPPADAEHLAKTAQELFKLDKRLEAIKTELLEIAHKYPCDPPLSDDFVLRIAETYGQRREPPKPKNARPPIAEVLDDPIKRKAWIDGLPNTSGAIIDNEYTGLRNLLVELGRDARTDPAGKAMIDAYRADVKRREGNKSGDMQAQNVPNVDCEALALDELVALINRTQPSTAELAAWLKAATDVYNRRADAAFQF